MSQIIHFQEELQNETSKQSQKDIQIAILNISSFFKRQDWGIQFKQSFALTSQQDKIVNYINFSHTRLGSLTFQILFKISQNFLSLTFQLDQSSNYFEIIRNLSKKYTQKFITFTSYINNLYFGSDTKGQFFYKQTGLHKLKQKIHKKSILKNNQMSFFIKKSILQLSKKYAQFVQSILDYFQIQLRECSIQQNCSIKNNVKDIKKNLFLLRIMFIKNYEIRQNITLDQLSFPQFMLNNGFSKLHNLPIYSLKGLLEEFQIRKSSLFQTAKNSIQQFHKTIQEELTDYQRLLSPVRINKLKKYQQNFTKGASSKISKGLFCFSEQLSCNNIDKNFPKKLEIIHRQKYLCKKQMIQQTNGVWASFQNQINFLHQKRNSRCKQIASYYFDISKNKCVFQQKTIYLDYYSRTLNEIIYSSNIKEKIRIIQQILKGLFYFKEEKFLHRDLKQENILLDKQNNIKIIDFGSVCKIYDSNKIDHTTDYDNTLRFTEDYSVSFLSLKKNYPQLAKLTNKKQFQRHINFDFSAFGYIISNMFGFNIIVQDAYDALSLQIRYIFCKCRQIMPNKRLTLQQMILYFKQLKDWSQIIFS